MVVAEVNGRGRSRRQGSWFRRTIAFPPRCRRRGGRRRGLSREPTRSGPSHTSGSRLELTQKGSLRSLGTCVGSTHPRSRPDPSKGESFERCLCSALEACAPMSGVAVSERGTAWSKTRPFLCPFELMDTKHQRGVPGLPSKARPMSLFRTVRRRLDGAKLGRRRFAFASSFARSLAVRRGRALWRS